MKKKIMALLLGLGMCLGLCGCSSSEKKDWDYIKDKGEVIIGITYYEPMNYLDDSGKLVGFETEFTEAVCEKLGVKPKFQEINWGVKEVELKSKTIDLIWNGMTVKPELAEHMSFSTTYLKNRQSVLIKKDNASKYPDMASLGSATIGVEDGSAGQSAIAAVEELKNSTVIPCKAQQDAVLEVKSGTVDAAVVDYTLARQVVTNEEFGDLMMVESIVMPDEEYAVGVRLEDTETLAKINQAIKELHESGKLLEIAKKYGVEDIYAL